MILINLVAPTGIPDSPVISPEILGDHHIPIDHMRELIPGVPTHHQRELDQDVQGPEVRAQRDSLDFLVEISATGLITDTK